MPKPNGDGTLICVYDAWNRMVEVVGTARYRYDGRNFRIEKSVGQVSTKSFFCSEWQELESRTGSETLTYVWGLRYIDDLVCRNRGNEKLYSLADPNWNVGALANAQGEVQERFTYDTFGRLAILSPTSQQRSSSSFHWNRFFTGQVLDNEVGLMLYRNRFYHVVLGRFLRRDSIGYQAQDLNLYRYVSSNPGTYTDEKGTGPLVAGGIGAAAGCALGGCFAGIRSWWNNESKCQIKCKSLGGCVSGAIIGTIAGLQISTGNVAPGASCAASALSSLVSNDLDNICDGICGEPTDMPWGCALGGAVSKLAIGCLSSWAKSAGKPLEQIMLTFVSHIAGYDVAQGCKFWTNF